MGKYQAGAASGISFAAACFAFLAGGPWSQFRSSGGLYIAGAVLGGLASATMAEGQGRRKNHAGRALACAVAGDKPGDVGGHPGDNGRRGRGRGRRRS